MVQDTAYPNWVFTFHYSKPGQPVRNDVQEFYDELLGLATYVVAGWEKGEDGVSPHLQGYVQFDTKKRLSALKKLKNAMTVHWEVAQGDEEQNYAYCTKEGEFMEFGEARIVNGGKREKKRWASALENCKAGNYELIDPQIQLQFCKQLDYIHDRYQAPPSDLPPNTKHLWIWGPSGTGKSRLARAIFQEKYSGTFYNKLQNKWWDHYNNSSPVLIDDLELETGKALVQYLKLWLDMYVFKVEYKGGAKDIRPPYIVITSNFHPWDIFGEKGEAWYEPIMRRLEVRWLGRPGEQEPQKGPALFHQPEFTETQISDVTDSPSVVEATPQAPRLVRQVAITASEKTSCDVIDLTDV